MRGYKTEGNMMQDASNEHNKKVSCNNKSKKGGVVKYFLFIVLFIVLLIVTYNLHNDQSSTPEQSNEEYVSNDTILNSEDSIQNNEVNEANEKKELLTGVHNGHEWVDLGLSVKWATCNIGASIPSDYGKYFAWGEIIQKSSYTEENYANKGRLFHDVSGNKQFDVASYIWGDLWRMPTKEEVEELIGCCSIEYAKVDTHNGIKLRSPNGNSIFIPCSGVRTESSYRGIGAYAVFWTSTQYDELSGYAFWRGKCTFTLGYEGLPIRPVMKIKDDI